jgi:hypothetical protein
MMLTKKNFLIATLVSAAIFAGKVQAQEAPSTNMSAEVNLDAMGNKNSNYNRTLRAETIVNFDAALNQAVKAVIKARLQDVLEQDGIRGVNNSQNIEKFLEEAYITIETDKISGLPRAVITAGKSEMAFGQGYTQVPMPRDSLLYNLSREREVVGLTVTLPTDYLKIADHIAVSVYENGAGDLKIADQKGVAIKASKKLTAQIDAEASALIKENAGASEKEKRGSLGFVFNGADGSYKVWAEGLVFDHNPAMVDMRNYGAQLGGSMRAGRGTIVVEYEQVQRTARELTLAYNLPYGKSVILSPMVKLSKNQMTGVSNTTVGARATLLFR